MSEKKPLKKTDKELWEIIADKLANNRYIFLNHAKQRLKDRHVSDLEVLNILDNKENHKRKRNKRKDTYIADYLDWNYCIEGVDVDKQKIRIIISFDSVWMLIITVIRIND